MPVSSTWLRLGAAEFDDGDILARPEVRDSPVPAIVNDLLWGGFPPTVTQIPYAWLIPTARFRPDSPLNATRVSRTNGATVVGTDTTSIAAFTATEFDADLDTAVDVDPANLSAHVLTYYATQPSQVPRQRCPTLTIDLVLVYQLAGIPGIWKVLDRKLGDRFAVTGTPTGTNLWPEGTTSLVIEGIRHLISADGRLVVWSTSPIVGSSPGVPGPWFYTDKSYLDGSDKVPF